MIKVSVILTTYDSECYIQEVIHSIKQQKGQGELYTMELIVVDDCSTDDTLKILQSENIPFISTEINSGGPNKGRNVALERSTGDFICIADHDDIWFTDRIEKLLSVTHLAPIVTSGYILSDLSSSEAIERVSARLGDEDYLFYEKNETFKSKLTKSKYGQQTYLGSILFSSSFKHILFEEEYGMIDFDWVLKLFYNQSSVELCIALYHRKVARNNLSLNEQYRLNDYNHSLSKILVYEEEYPSLVKCSARRINGSMGRYYYLMGNKTLSRIYFLKSYIGFKTILYIITTFVGSKIVKRYFKIFG